MLLLLPVLDKSLVGLEGDEVPEVEGTPDALGTAKDDLKLVELVQASFICRLLKGNCGGVVTGLRLMLLRIGHPKLQLEVWKR